MSREQMISLLLDNWCEKADSDTSFYHYKDQERYYNALTENELKNLIDIVNQ